MFIFHPTDIILFHVWPTSFCDWIVCRFVPILLLAIGIFLLILFVIGILAFCLQKRKGLLTIWTTLLIIFILALVAAAVAHLLLRNQARNLVRMSLTENWQQAFQANQLDPLAAIENELRCCGFAAPNDRPASMNCRALPPRFPIVGNILRLRTAVNVLTNGVIVGLYGTHTGEIRHIQ